MFVIFNKKTKEAIKCHGPNTHFEKDSTKNMRKALDLKRNEDYVRLNKACIEEIRSSAFDNL